MEFLNPEDKRARTIKLFTGYILIAILIGLATLILVYLAQGYGYDPSKGVSRNGLVFISAKPTGANVFVDNQDKGKTDTRLTLSEGVHQITLQKDKYRNWDKTVSVDGGSVLYLLYPRLFPVDIPLGITQAFAAAPALVSESLDRHWLVYQPTAGSLNLTVFDTTKPTTDAKVIALPTTQVINDKNGYGNFSAIEWSDDNKHLLVKQTISNGQVAYIMVDREDANQTINLTAKLGLQQTVSVSLRDKNYDTYYVFTPTSGAIQTADLKSGVQSSPLVSGVVAFKSFGDNLLLYVTYTGTKDNEANVFVLRDGKDTFKLQTLPRDANNSYLLDMAQYDGAWLYVTASTTDKKVLLYRDPLDKAKAGDTTPISPRLALVLANPEFASFSDNARFIALQSGQQFVIYDAELGRVYRYQSTLAIAAHQPARWMDGHRLSVVTDGKVQVFDFDGTNLQTLTASRPEFTGYFDRDYQYLFTFIQQADGRTALQNGKLVVD